MMRIEKIEPTGSRDYVRLRFSGGISLRTPATVAAELGLRAGQELSGEELALLKEKTGQVSARLRAVRIIAASGVSEKELRRRLVQKGERPEHAEEAVQWLDDLHLLDDRETARQIVARGAARGYGKARVRQMLYEKGIDRELWDEALSQLPPPDDAIDRFLEKRLDGDPKTLKKTTDALLRRGYSWEDIREGLERYRLSLEEV